MNSAPYKIAVTNVTFQRFGGPRDAWLPKWMKWYSSREISLSCKGNLQIRGDGDSKESEQSIETKQGSKQLAIVGGIQQ